MTQQDDINVQIDERLLRTFTDDEVINFYRVRNKIVCEGYRLEDDFNPLERQGYRKVLNFVEEQYRSEDSVVVNNWLMYLKDTWDATVKEQASPFDQQSFIMDLSGVIEAKPTPALFELEDSNGEPQLFMPRGKVAVLASEGGLGKSLLALHLGVSLALNQPTKLKSWCGRPLTPVPKSGKVILLYAEEDKQSCLYRLRQQLAGVSGRVDPKLLEALSGRLIPVPLCITDRDVDSSLSLSDSIRSKEFGAEHRRNRLYKSLKEIAGDDGIDLIVIDPLAQFGGSDFETDNGEASRLMRHLQQLTGLKGNPTILIVHHSAKGNSKRPAKLSNAVRGSSAIKDNARWAGILRRIAEDDTGENYLKDIKGRGVIEMVVAKSNYGPSFLKVRCISHESKIIDIQNGDTLLTLNTLLKTVEESQTKYKETVLDTSQKLQNDYQQNASKQWGV